MNLFADHLRGARRAFGHSPWLSALMALALAMGIGACMTTLTVYRVLAGDPMPGKSERLFNVSIDAGDLQGYRPGSEPMFQLSRFDAETLLREGRAKRQVAMSGASALVRNFDARAVPAQLLGRYANRDFFAMFEVPFQYGGAWSAQDDADQARVVVLSHALNAQLFGGANSVGQQIIVGSTPLRIVGVMAAWRLVPRFYDLTTGAYNTNDAFYLPLSTAMALELGNDGSLNCWGDSAKLALRTPCAWLQYWVELESPAQAPAFLAYLNDYSERQRKAGWLQRPPNARLDSVMRWLDKQKALPADVRLQTVLAFGFLFVCLINMAGLLLAKTLRRAGEIGVRRALGASRRTVFAQFLVEAGSVGVVGALLGWLLAQGGLWLVRQSPAPYAHLAHMDPVMLAVTLGLALLASVLAGLLPAWRATLVQPALQLKVQ